MLTSANQYLRPEYLPPVSSPVSETKNISIENTIDTNLIWKNYNNNNLVGPLWADYLKFNLLYQKKNKCLIIVEGRYPKITVQYSTPHCQVKSRQS